MRTGWGQYGVEGALNDELVGTDGLLKTVKDINNVALSIGEDNIKIPSGGWGKYCTDD